MIRLAVALFAVQAGFHGFTAALPVALARAGMPDPHIGLIVGIAALVQIPAAFLAGVVVDRLGGIRAFVGAGIAYLVGCAILLAPGVEPGGSPWPFALARAFQGIGIAATLPAALSLVPRLVEPARRGFGLAFVGAARDARRCRGRRERCRASGDADAHDRADGRGRCVTFGSCGRDR